MKKIVFLFLVITLASCATVKTKQVAITPVGDWDYTITGTPNGDYAGVLSVAEKESALSATMKSGEGEIPFTNFSFDKTTNIAAGNFNFQGTDLVFNATVVGETMTGTIATGGYGFPFKATRKAKS
ncbi:MAG TPA: hypothetical protein PLJ60_03200 [Chryseolinea sp.]|nr:hypothetical protein [Chryseolinea sp.]HPH45871.1 hypothetical protein [Chryseolinea sp.]HPM29320.1 hypothetical protein [Chryseolinea sp.]